MKAMQRFVARKRVEQLKEEGQQTVLIQRSSKEKGLSQQQLAEIIEVTLSTMSQIEAGMEPPLHLLVKVLEIAEQDGIVSERN